MNDYLSLANIAKPTMMPSAPEGAGGVAGWMYGSDQARQDELIRKAGGVAQLQAQMEAMKAEELAMGSAGRRDNINLGNLKSANALSNYKDGGAELEKAQQGNDLLKALSPYINALGGDDDDAAQAAYEELKSNYPSFAQVSFDKMRKKAKAIVYGQGLGSPAHAQKKDLEETKGEYKLTTEFMKQQGANTRKERELLVKVEMGKLAKKNPTLFQELLTMSGGDYNAAFEAYLRQKSISVEQQGNATAGQFNAITGPNGPKMPNVQPPKVEGGASSTAAVGNKKVPKIGDVWGTQQGDKKIIGIRKDPKTGKILQLNVEGVGVVDYK